MEGFALPFAAVFTCSKNEAGKFIAHALDFDLVCVNDTEEQAMERLRSTVKAYIEFGFSRGWSQHIKFPAPDQYWEEAWKAEHRMIPMEPILIDSTIIRVLRVEEHETCGVAA